MDVLVNYENKKEIIAKILEYLSDEKYRRKLSVY
jgi:hypothetical protein